MKNPFITNCYGSLFEGKDLLGVVVEAVVGKIKLEKNALRGEA